MVMLSDLDGGAAVDQLVDVGDPPGRERLAGVGARLRRRRRVRLDSVRENRGAGAGWSTPSRSTYTPRALRCGWSLASLIGMIAATQASVPSKTSAHSAWVRVANRSVISSRSSSVCWGRSGRGRSP